MTWLSRFLIFIASPPIASAFFAIGPSCSLTLSSKPRTSARFFACRFCFCSLHFFCFFFATVRRPTRSVCMLFGLVTTSFFSFFFSPFRCRSIARAVAFALSLRVRFRSGLFPVAIKESQISRCEKKRNFSLFFLRLSARTRSGSASERTTRSRPFLLSGSPGCNERNGSLSANDCDDGGQREAILLMKNTKINKQI